MDEIDFVSVFVLWRRGSSVIVSCDGCLGCEHFWNSVRMQLGFNGELFLEFLTKARGDVRSISLFEDLILGV